MVSDITQNKHGGDPESIAANKRVNKVLDRTVVLNLITDAGAQGLTLDEISERLDRPPNVISGRITELKERGLIAASDARRKTRTGSLAKVYVLPGLHG